MARLEQGVAAPLEESEVEVAVLPDARLRASRSAADGACRPRLFDHVQVKVDGAAQEGVELFAQHRVVHRVAVLAPQLFSAHGRLPTSW